MPPTPDAYWLALRRVKGIGPRIAQLLLEKFESPDRIFGLPERSLIDAGIGKNVAAGIAAFDGFDELERELCELPRIGARLVRWSDADYPVHLRHIADPPPYLFARGATPPDEASCVAVVGARAASDAGRRMARRLGFELAAKGFTVISGLARGIDSEAHQGAVDAGGRTIAVMGCGIDVIYPAEHRGLADAILSGGGALLSELPVGTPPIAENFPTRNRVLSGLCLGVVIVEAAEKSGSLITARMALDQDRQVFAVPGSPLTGRSRGSNGLLKEGAVLVECVEDVIEVLIPQLGTRRPGDLQLSESQASGPIVATSAAESSREATSVDAEAKVKTGVEEDAKIILGCLKNDEKLHIDSIIEGSRLEAKTVLRFLLELELRGLVQQHPGKLFSLG